MASTQFDRLNRRSVLGMLLGGAICPGTLLAPRDARADPLRFEKGPKGTIVGTREWPTVALEIFLKVSKWQEEFRYVPLEWDVVGVPTFSERVHLFDALIVAACRGITVRGLPLPPALVKAHMVQESGMFQGALSWMGAMGLMQFITATAEGVGIPNAQGDASVLFDGLDYSKGAHKAEMQLRSWIRADLAGLQAGGRTIGQAIAASGLVPRAKAYWVLRYRTNVVSGAWVPEYCIPAGARYIAELQGQFNLAGGVAGYNCGPGNVHRWRDIPETRGYVYGVLAHYKTFLYEFPLQGAPPPPPPGSHFYVAP